MKQKKTIWYLSLNMTISEAEQFIADTDINNSQPSVWADLGCGSGMFSKVLSARLYNGSRIYAIDKLVPSAIASLKKEVEIVFKQADFVIDNLPLSGLHGILMANSLHYMQNKKDLIRKLRKYLLPGAVFVIIEYDNAKANRWVPYPVSFSELKILFEGEGYRTIQKTGERKSIYQSGAMYIGLIKT